jgi:hypothetical protein
MMETFFLMPHGTPVEQAAKRAAASAAAGVAMEEVALSLRALRQANTLSRHKSDQ